MSLPARFHRTAILLLVFAGYASSMTIRTSRTTIEVPAGEVVDDTLVAAAERVVILGTVNGDLIAFAREIDVRGAVKGNTVAFAQEVRVSGSVEGSAFTFSQLSEFNGAIARNIYAFGQSVRLLSGSDVQGDAVCFGATAALEGGIRRDLRIFSGNARISGNIGRNVDFAGGKLNVESPARIGGNLAARIRDTQDLQVASGAVIGGRIERGIVVRRPQRAVVFFGWQILALLAALLTGWILSRLAPSLVDASVRDFSKGWAALGIGFITLIVVPAALILIAITVVGLPIALIGFWLYATGVYLSTIVAAFFLGDALFGRMSHGAARTLGLLIGLIVLRLLFLVPFVGWAFRLVITCMGLGSLAWATYQLGHRGGTPGPHAAA